MTHHRKHTHKDATLNECTKITERTPSAFTIGYVCRAVVSRPTTRKHKIWFSHSYIYDIPTMYHTFLFSTYDLSIGTYTIYFVSLYSYYLDCLYYTIFWILSIYLYLGISKRLKWFYFNWLSREEFNITIWKCKTSKIRFLSISKLRRVLGLKKQISIVKSMWLWFRKKLKCVSLEMRYTDMKLMWRKHT